MLVEMGDRHLVRKKDGTKAGGRNRKDVYTGQWVPHAAWGRVQHEDGGRPEWSPTVEPSKPGPVPHSPQRKAEKMEGC